MKKLNLLPVLLFVAGNLMAQVHTTYLWHMQQPIYWPEKSQANPNRYQVVRESYDLLNSGGNIYSDGKAHPMHDLQNEVFGKADRVNAYQWTPRNSVDRIKHLPEAGAQVNYSGCLMENVNSLAAADYFGYKTGWQNYFREAKGWKTSGGSPRLDMVGFTFHHALSPLISERSLAKELQANKHISVENFGDPYSKGYWPAECSFSERIIKVLVQEGFEWSIVANSHLSRTLDDFPLSYGTSVCNISPPNKADKVSTKGVNYWSGTEDGRGGTNAAPYSYQAHKAKYVDPETGVEYKITVVPMDDVLSYKDGYSAQGTELIDAHIAPFNNPAQPSIVLLAHDGDNAWGGGSSYYQEAVPNFTQAAANKGYTPTTIQQFLNDHPAPENDVVRVEDGSWVNAENDWGHPQFINWLWPLYDKTNYRFDPNGWTEDARNFAVITAAENFVWMAEDLAGGTNIAKIIYPDASASDAEKAWHFFLPSLASCYMYYGDSRDMEVKQSLAGNHAIAFAKNEISKHSGTDRTGPTVFIPQRFPYNPGGEEFGPVYGYKVTQSSSDFHVWTFAYDVSGLQSVELKYRTDDDGLNPLSDNANDTYAGGEGVADWASLTMTQKTFPKGNVTNNPNIDFFILPDEIADLCYAEIKGLSNVLVDYYVEATDIKGNVFKTPIQHVYVGQYNSSDKVTLGVTPPDGNYSDTIEVNMNATTTATGASVNIYYTTNGTTPTNQSTLYSGTIKLYKNTSLKAIAIDSKGNQSDVVSRTYSFGDVEEVTVHFKNTANWSDVNIYLFNWATKGALPGWNWPGVDMEREQGSSWYKYTIKESVQTGIVINNGGSLKTADLTRTTEGWYDFNTKQWYDACPGDCPTAPVPVLSVSPLGGSYENTVTVTLSATNSGVIRYTTDGSDPRSGSAYASSLTFTTTTRLRAIATNSFGESNEIDQTYTISYPKPVLTVNPTGKEFTGTLDVSLSATKSGVIKYTLNGNDPRTGSNYTSSISLTASTRLRAIASNANGYSNEIDEQYTLVENQCDTIFYYNKNNWSTVKIYLFNANGTGLPGWTWPGVNMVRLGTTNWYYHVNCETVNVGMVFNNGSGSQTGNLYSNAGWYYSNSQWYTSCPGECPGQGPVGLTLHCRKPSSWANVYIYYWSTSPVSLTTSWPGQPMTDSDGDGWYDYTLPGVSCANVIFSNKGASQTPDLKNICAESWYDNGWVTNKSATSMDNVSYNQSRMRIYPNPVLQDEITISLPVETVSTYYVSLFTIAGKLIQVLEFTGSEATLNIEDLSSGVYFITVRNAISMDYYQEKLFVQ
ncbi:MAG: starch-binding protein [Bacteroidota bacterium]|nr:MAG: starch-binding protein [Bacteroidota bacterium]